MKTILTALFIFLSYLLQAQYTWKNAPQGAGGYITGIVVHPKNPNLIYVRTDVGGLYKWNASTSTWLPMMEWADDSEAPDYYSVDGIALDYNNQNVVWACVGDNQSLKGAILKSTDYGVTWSVKRASTTYLGNQNYRWAGEPIQVDGRNTSGNVVYAGTRKFGLVYTRDGGTTWTQATGIPNGTVDGSGDYIGIRAVAIDTTSGTTGGTTSGSTATRSNIIYVGNYNDGIYRSTDGGSTWAKITGSPKIPYQIKVASNGIMYCTASDGVYKYSGGVMTNIKPTGVKTYRYNALAISPTNPSKIIIVTDRYDTTAGPHKLPIYYSTNAGSTWSSNLVSKSSWTYQAPWYSGTGRFSSATASIIFDPANDSKVYFTDWYQVMKTDNINATTIAWNQIIKGIEEMVTLDVLSPAQDESTDCYLLAGVGDNGGFRNTSDIDYPNYPSSKLSDAQYNSGLDFCESYPNWIVTASGTQSNSVGHNYYSRDNGRSFIETGLAGYVGKVAMSATDTTNWVVATVDAGLRVTTNKGSSWTTISSLPVDMLYSQFSVGVPLASDRVTGGTFYFLKKTGGLFKSANKGISWDSVGKVNGVGGYYVMKTVFGRAGHIWVASPGGTTGLYRSTDGGSNFSKISNVTEARLVAFGKDSAGGYPTVFVYGTVKGVTGLFRSTDGGSTTPTWVRITDDNNKLGIVYKALAADRKTFGRVYFGSRGRGVYIGESTATVVTPPPTNHAPTANAGNNVTITLPTDSVKLNGSGSTDPDGDALTYQWRIISGTGGSIANTDKVAATLSGLTSGKYIISLTVSDPGGLSDEAAIEITVNSAPTKVTKKKYVKTYFKNN